MLQVHAKLLERYEIISPLGAGGMGEVYRARDLRLEREVAIKLLPEHLGKDPHALARFEREAKALAALSHPNILSIFDFGEHGGVAFAVMELLKGETLRSRVSRTKLTWKEAVAIGGSVVDGLAAAHSQGVIHRDLKPENIFLTPEGRVKILDFGLAKQEYSIQKLTQSPTVSEPLTESQTVPGTVPYMSPEQLKGADLDVRTDLFSFGSMLYEMISGKPPFSGETSHSVAASILKGDRSSTSISGCSSTSSAPRPDKYRSSSYLRNFFI